MNDGLGWWVAALIVISGAVYMAIKPEQHPERNESNIRCFDGVQYYMIREYQKGFMSPVYDATTRQVKLCGER